jgi:threonine dehydratase
MIPYEWLEQASTRIAPYIKITPLTYDPTNDLYLKWENHQLTGSFKVRGALNKVLSLEKWELERGLVTASAGNHGQGIALAAGLEHAPVKVFVSEHAAPNKIMAMRDLGAELHFVPGGYAEAESAGITFAKNTGATWVSPYNDGMVIAGQGTIGLELLNQIPNPSSVIWLIPAGGGGLVSGIGSAFHGLGQKPRLVAVQSEASPYLHSVYYHGTQAGVVELPSLADGLAGPIEADSVTIPMVMNYVDDVILVSEDEIRKAIKYAWNSYHECIEGSAAVTLAVVLSGRVSARPALVVLTGGNIDPAEHAKIINNGNIGSFQV